jgi:hypothetical protein
MTTITGEGDFGTHATQANDSGRYVLPDLPPELAAEAKRLALAAPPLSAEARSHLRALMMPARSAGTADPDAKRPTPPVPQPPPPDPTGIYRYYDEQDRLLYLGVTWDDEARDHAHEKTAIWFRWRARRAAGEVFATRREAEAFERAAITAEEPIFNRQGAGDGAHQRQVDYLIEREAWELLSLRGLEYRRGIPDVIRQLQASSGHAAVVIDWTAGGGR